MKKMTKLLCLLLVLCVSLGFAACKGDDAAQGGAAEIPTDTATIYYLSGVKYGEEKVWNTSELMISDPAQTYIFFDTDGSGILSIDTFETYFQYADGQLWEELAPDTPVNYIVQGDALTLEQDGYKLVFTRGELPDWALPDETVEEVPGDEIPEEVFEEEVPEATEAATN